jgi:hypothetical protein
MSKVNIQVQSNKSTNDVDVNELYETFESDINTIFDKHVPIKEIDKLSSGDTFSITNNEDFKELKGIEDSKLIDTAHQCFFFGIFTLLTF